MRLLNSEKFIRKAKEIHGDRYDYSLAEYTNNNLKLKIICSIHGVFEQTPHIHLKGCGCRKCSNISIGIKNRHSLEHFLKLAKEKHGDRYDYSLVNYINNYTVVKIICPVHGIYEQKPGIHIRKSGCQKCGDEVISTKNSSNTKKFITKSLEVHKNKYDYSLVSYKKSFVAVKILCPNHGVFEQTPSSHLSGYGCKKCGKEKFTNSHKKTQEEFIKESKLIFGEKYDYSKVNYVNCKMKVIIICPEHGLFNITPDSHICGKRGCQKCSWKNTGIKLKSNIDSFIDKAKQIHGSKYNYSKADYRTAIKKVVIVCPKHGDFKQSPNSHIGGEGCPRCNDSYGERIIAIFLQKYDILYVREKRFDKCIDKKLLPFDFYLPKSNTCIEFDGPQHSIPYKYYKGEKGLEDVKRRDSIKNNFCLDNNIKLIRIPYTMRKKEIDTIIKNIK